MDRHAHGEARVKGTLRGLRLLRGASIATLLFLYLPIFFIMAFSFNSSRYGAHWAGFTWQWYARMFANEAILRATLNSLIVALSSSLLSVVLAVPAAVALERFSFKRAGLWEAALFLPVVIPELMMAVGFLLLFGLLHLRFGLWTLILGHTTLNLPIVWLIVRSRLKKLDSRLEEAAMDLGATPWTAFWKVTFPLLLPAVLGGTIMAFAVSLDDFVISFFVVGPDSTTLPIQIYSMLKFSISPEVGALSTALFLVSMSLVIGAWKLLDRREFHAA
jgi:spermidine/putrescine transport system permease protein